MTKGLYVGCGNNHDIGAGDEVMISKQELKPRLEVTKGLVGSCHVWY